MSDDKKMPDYWRGYRDGINYVWSIVDALNDSIEQVECEMAKEIKITINMKDTDDADKN